MERARVARRLGLGLMAVSVALGFASNAVGQGLAAIVESVSPASEHIHAFDVLSEGTVIQLEPGQMLVLGYMDSCSREEISGGKVTIGAAGSKVEGGAVNRTTMACGGSVDPDSAAGANEAAVVAIRSLGDDAGATVHVVPSGQPVFVLAEGPLPSDPSLIIQRIDRSEPPIRVSLFGRTLDLKQTGMKLTPGGIYSAACGDRKVAFKIADNAGVGPVVTLQRVVRF